MNGKRKTAPNMLAPTSKEQSSHNTISISENSINVKNESLSVPLFRR